LLHNVFLDPIFEGVFAVRWGRFVYKSPTWLRHESFKATLDNSSILMTEAAGAYLTPANFEITGDSALN
jgi:hypothetical protein